MKKKNVLFIMILAVCMISSLTFTSLAETKDANWTVKYSDGKIVDNFTGDINDALSKMQPGDEATFEISLKNSGSEETRWYMKNSVLTTLEESNKAANDQGGMYEYVLKYNNEEIVDSQKVGGEGSKAKGAEGLKEATQGLEDWFFVGTLAAGESGKVSLKVALDPETQGNAYQKTAGSLNMKFAVEENTPGKTVIVETGDTTSMVLWISMFALSAVLLAIAILLIFKKRKEEK